MVLLKRGGITRSTTPRYAKGLRANHPAYSNEEEGKVLDRFTAVTGRHRKAAIRLLHRGSKAEAKWEHGPPRRDGDGVVSALRLVWEATDRRCSKRLHPFLHKVMRALKRHAKVSMAPEIVAQLRRTSPGEARPRDAGSVTPAPPSP